jgi:uncharacterized protein (DUF1800 family)
VSYNQQKLLAGHLLRHIGFGPSAADVSAVLSQGWDEYINSQLNPPVEVDSATEAKFISLVTFSVAEQQRRWYTRMLYSPWQLQEKMTLILHEHFSVSSVKVSNNALTYYHENFLRTNALGSFRDILIGISIDPAMMAWLDNNGNNGTTKDAQGNIIPPNINYAREFLQLFALGTDKLDRYGNIVWDSNGKPVPAYTEADVKAVARALTGWLISDTNSVFLAQYAGHDPDDKVLFGVTIKGTNTFEGGPVELAQVVDLVMKQPTHSRFIAKILIQKLATETPSPAYIDYVGQVYARNNFSLKYAVQAILTYPEFTSDAVVRNQYRTPIEEFVGALRGLNAYIPSTSQDNLLLDWTARAGHLIHNPPSVFSFYPPGQKKTLINTALVTYRTQAANAFVTSPIVNFITLVPQTGLTPALAVDFLSDALLCAPLDAAVRDLVISYMDGSVSENKLQGAAWLILCSPDFQRN